MVQKLCAWLVAVALTGLVQAPAAEETHWLNCVDVKAKSAPSPPWLKEIEEEDLRFAACDPTREVYRLTWVEVHLGRQTSAVRVDIRRGKATVVWKETKLVIEDGRSPMLEADVTAAVSTEQLARLRASFDAADFWSLGAQPVSPDCLRAPMFIIEAARDDRYHEISRSCGVEDSLRAWLVQVKALTQPLRATAAP